MSSVDEPPQQSRLRYNAGTRCAHSSGITLDCDLLLRWLLHILQAQQTPHADHGIVALDFLAVDSSGEHVDDLAAMSLVRETLEGKWIFPEAVEHGLDDVLSLVGVDLVIEERILRVGGLSAEILIDGLGRELRFLGAEQQA